MSDARYRDHGTVGAKPLVVDPSAHAEAITSSHVEVLNVAIEVDDRLVAPLLPAPLRLTLPPMVTFAIWRFHDSSLGAFTLAQTRVTTRLRVRSRGLVLGSYFQGAPAAAEQLRAHWGFACLPGNIRLVRHHDEIRGTVETGGTVALELVGRAPHAIGPGDIREMSALNPIRALTSEGEQARLLQVDTEFRVEAASRSIQLELQAFNGSTWNTPDITQEYGVRALHYHCELRLPPPRYLFDPVLAPEQESQEIRQRLTVA